MKSFRSLRANLLWAGGLLLCWAAFAGPVQAWGSDPYQGGAAPEIDPSSLAGALTFLVGGVLVLTERFRKA